MTQIHKLILREHEVRYYVSQWQHDVTLQDLFERFRLESTDLEVTPGEHFVAWLLQQPNLFFAGATEIPTLSEVDEFQLPVRSPG